ncbi:MAG: ubiquitin [Bacillota bacterium]|nr:ubiquitin [Bacillota bacterium]
MSKKIRTTDTDLTVTTGTSLIVKVGAFKFIKEETYPWIDIYMTGGKTDELLEQNDSEKTDELIDLEELKIFALNWMFNNVEIVKEIESIEN